MGFLCSQRINLKNKYFCAYFVREYGGCHMATTNIKGTILVDVFEIHLTCISCKGMIWFEACKLYFEKKISYVMFKATEVCLAFLFSFIGFLDDWFFVAF